MSITFEEITADVVAEPPRDERNDEGGEMEAGGLEFAERVRAVLLREKRRLDRLSDR